MNVVKKQKLFDEYMQKLDAIGKIKSPSQKFRAMMDIEDFLELIYERGFNAGFEKGINQSIDELKK